ncbi:hypothetical protein [Flagellimonas aurea]|uniref:hypothetical protein n=1 Tax=Flagellimonas aurea TaxID=2915619 RepID=UPI0035CF3B70
MKVSQEEPTFFIEDHGYIFEIKFRLISDELCQYITIKPRGNQIQGRSLEFDFQSNKYYNFWNSIITLPFKVKELVITDFTNNFHLNNLIIKAKDREVDVIIKSVHSRIKIESCNKVTLEKIQSSSIEVSEINNLIIADVGFQNNATRVNIRNSKNAIVTKIVGDEFRLVGKTDKAELNHSMFNKVRLVEPSFNQITFFDFDIIDFSIEIGNRENLEGKLTLVDSNITGVFKVHSCRLGSPSLPQRIIEWAFKKQSMYPIYLDIRDNRINPVKVEFTEVEWHYNGILKNQKYPEGKRKIINQAKNYYINNDDIYYTQLLYSFEKNWYYRHHRFSFPLTLSKWSNDFGLNLWWPLLWMLLFISIESILILNLSWNCYDKLSQNWGVFAHLINPTHSTSIFMELFEGNCEPPLFYTNWLPVIDNFFRILIAYSIFQFANAFRYKFKLR